MLTIPTYLSKSNISGIGVFAGRSVKKGEAVWMLDAAVDVFFPDTLIASMPADVYAFFDPHLYRDKGIYTDGYIYNTDNAKFTNHSFEPNISCRGPVNVALRDIEAGEELTCDYRDFDWDSPEDMPEFLRQPSCSGNCEAA